MNDILVESAADGVTDSFQACARLPFEDAGVDKDSMSRRVLGVIPVPIPFFLTRISTKGSYGLGVIFAGHIFQGKASEPDDLALEILAKLQTSSLVHSFRIY